MIAASFIPSLCIILLLSNLILTSSMQEKPLKKKLEDIMSNRRIIKRSLREKVNSTFENGTEHDEEVLELTKSLESLDSIQRNLTQTILLLQSNQGATFSNIASSANPAQQLPGNLLSLLLNLALLLLLFADFLGELLAYLLKRIPSP